MSRNFRLSCLVTMVTVLVGSHVSFSSARHTDSAGSRVQANRISKRDVGLELHCMLHPRNCPEDYFMDKRDRLDRTGYRGYNPRPSSSSSLDPLPEKKAIVGDHKRPLANDDADDRQMGAFSRDLELSRRLISLLRSRDLYQGSHDRRKTW